MRTVVGLYDNLDDARMAVQALQANDFAREDISLIASDEKGSYSNQLEGGSDSGTSGAVKGAGIGAVLGGLGGLLLGLGALAIPGIGPVIAAGPIAATLAGAGIGAVSGGIVGALVDLGIPEDHAQLYEEGLRRGGTLIVVRSQDEMADQAADIMNQFSPINIQERSQEWQQGSQSSQSDVSYQRDMDYQNVDTDEREMSRADLQHSQVPVTGDRDHDMTIPVVEEDLLVSKREVDKGGVRIDKHTTEHEVEENINLRDENINVDRRPVNRDATEADFKAFEEGSMELRETKEEPVVDKRARVVEEVYINKDIEERDETIHDTVRRQDVDVQRTDVQRTGGEWNRYEQMYQQDFQSRYGTSGHDYNYYQPAYRYGYDLRSNPHYQSYTSWNDVERDARMDWERRGSQSKWEDVKDAVRHAWESITR